MLNTRQIKTIHALIGNGRENAITSDDIANRLGIHARTNEPIRAAIRQLVESEGECIGSCSDGYYRIIDEEDLALTVENLKSRGRAVFTRAKHLEANYREIRNLKLGGVNA
jgi:hypothetical protein